MAGILRNWLRIRAHGPPLARLASGEKPNIVLYDPFKRTKDKDRETYIALVKHFETRDNRRRGHVEFIYAALAQMKDFGVHKDLEAYKTVLEVLPKGRFIPENIFQAEFQHYPKQQQCAVDLLEQMEDNGVMPDTEMEQILLNIFGRRGLPVRKYWRMMYWMPKFRNLSPWPLPEKMPFDSLELAKLAIQRITSVDPDTHIDVLETKDIAESLDKTWIVSAQSVKQQELLAEQPPDEPLVVRGPYRLYLRDQAVSYFTLIGKIREAAMTWGDDGVDEDDVSTIKVPPPMPGAPGAATLPAVRCSVHEQDDGTVCAVCATGTSSRDSLLSWIRLLERNGNPLLETLPVIFTMLSPSNDLVVAETKPVGAEDKRTESDNTKEAADSRKESNTEHSDSSRS